MRRSTVLLVGSLFAATGLMVSCDDDDSTGPDEQYVVELTGANEVPPRTTSATATATITVVNETTINLDITAQNLTLVTQAHFHAGIPGENGTIIHGFLANAAPSGPINGTLVSSTITPSSTFNGSFTFDSLLTRIRAGTTYLNVHTTTFPPGEIRGQVVP